MKINCLIQSNRDSCLIFYSHTRMRQTFLNRRFIVNELWKQLSFSIFIMEWSILSKIQVNCIDICNEYTIKKVIYINYTYYELRLNLLKCNV